MPRKRANTNTCKNTNPPEQTGKPQSISAAIPEASKRVEKQPTKHSTAVKQNGLSQAQENFYDGPAVRTRRKVNPAAYENRPSTSNGHEFYSDTDEESNNKRKGKRKAAATTAAAKTSREKKKKKLNESDQVKETVKEVIKEEDVNGNGVMAAKQKEQKEKEQNEEKLPAVIQQQQQVAVKPQPQQQEQQQVQPEYTAAEQQLRMGDRFLSRELLSREKKKFIEIWLSGEGLHFAQMFDT